MTRTEKQNIIIIVLREPSLPGVLVYVSALGAHFLPEEECHKAGGRWACPENVCTLNVLEERDMNKTNLNYHYD